MMFFFVKIKHMYFHEPESKQSSSPWLTKGSSPPTKYRTGRSCNKAMMIFWDEHGILVSHFVKAGQTVNAAYYCHVLRTELYPALHEKRPHLWAELIILQHDNARPHSALITQATIAELVWELLEHPAYSPDLATSDFFLFGRLKVFMQGRTFINRGGMAAAVHQWVGTWTCIPFRKL